MIKMKYLILIVATLLSINATAQFEFGDLIINEFVASSDSLSGISDPSGSYADWIEIYNPQDTPIILSGYHLSDNYDNPEKWTFPPNALIEANGYLIVWADNDTLETGVHTNFRLSKAGEQILLSSPIGTPLDSVGFGEQVTNLSAARFPNGTGGFIIQHATPMANNEIQPAPTISQMDVSINEFVADNDSLTGVADEFGGYGDWIELYNNTNQAIDLGGCFLSDTVDIPTRWAFRMGTSIPANDYLIIWADKDPEEGPLHTNFSLSSDGEAIILTNVNGTLIDGFTYEAQQEGYGMSRIPNGTGDFVFKTPTFNANNEIGLGIQNAAEIGLSLYPNPVTSMLNIQSDIAYESMRILDSTGKLMLEKHDLMDQQTIELSEWPVGIYFLQINIKDQNYQTRFSVLK